MSDEQQPPVEETQPQVQEDPKVEEVKPEETKPEEPVPVVEEKQPEPTPVVEEQPQQPEPVQQEQQEQLEQQEGEQQEGEQQEGEGEGEGEGQGEGSEMKQSKSQEPLQLYEMTELQRKEYKKAMRDSNMKEQSEYWGSINDSRKAEYVDLTAAQNENKKIVNLQICYGCKYHQWCTKHDESKYTNMANSLKAAVTATCGPEFFVSINTMAPEFWRIGCFDIVIGEKILFSKNKANIWPSSKLMANRIKEEFESR